MFNNDDDISMTLGEHFGYPNPAKAEASKELITNDAIGVEIELELADHMDAPDGWTVHNDGSLRDNGIEFVFNSPQTGKRAIKSIDAYEENFRAPRTLRRAVQISSRTSMHVHVDCTDLTSKELLDMFMIYVIFELPLFKSYAPTRMNNHFAHAVTDCADFVSMPRSLNSGYEQFAKSMNIPNIGRYCALNVKSLFKFGTFEFRHMQAVKDKKSMVEWINTCLAFKRAGQAHLNIPDMFFFNSAQGFLDQARQIFPRETVEKFLSVYKNEQEFNRDVVQGIRWAQNAVIPRIII